MGTPAPASNIEVQRKIPLTKESVRKLLKDNKYLIGEVVKRKSKNNSPVWNHIRCVIDENQNLVNSFFYCTICSDIVTNESNTTTPFIRHVAACMKNKNQMTITQFAVPPAVEQAKKTVKISMHHQQRVRDGMIQFICSDIRPFSAVEGKGFVAAMCAGIELGQAYPNLNPSEFNKVLPSRSTVQREIENKVDLAKKKVKAKLQEAYRVFHGFSCTSDLWSDDYRQKSYITVTAIVPLLGENEIKFERYIIGVQEVKEAVKTKEVIESHILGILLSYGFSESDVKSSIYFVTDRGSNFKTTDKFKRANCFAHMLHNIVKAMCKDTEFVEIITNAKDLVRYIKKGGLNYRCDLRLKSYCDTRWSTVYTMLNSIVLKFDDIYKVLEVRQNQNKRYRDCLQYIECLHKSTLAAIVEFLEPFKVWTDLVEADKCITIHRVSPIHYKITNYLKASAEKDPKVLASGKFRLIEGIKALGREYIRSTLKSDFDLTIEQNIAVALHCRMKKLKRMSHDTREKTYKKLNELILGDVIPVTMKETKQKRQSQNLFDSFVDSDEEETENSNGNICKELSDYLRMPITEDNRDDSTVQSEWWFKHRTIFPNLFKIFMRISSIPASSASSERCFSVTGQIVSEKRSSILPENVANIAMVRNLY